MQPILYFKNKAVRKFVFEVENSMTDVTSKRRLRCNIGFVLFWYSFILHSNKIKDFIQSSFLLHTVNLLGWGIVACPVIQAIGRPDFEDGMRTRSPGEVVSDWPSVRTSSMVTLVSIIGWCGLGVKCGRVQSVMGVLCSLKCPRPVVASSLTLDGPKSYQLCPAQHLVLWC